MAACALPLATALPLPLTHRSPLAFESYSSSDTAFATLELVPPASHSDVGVCKAGKQCTRASPQRWTQHQAVQSKPQGTDLKAICISGNSETDHGLAVGGTGRDGCTVWHS